jgi:hypothetical protein
MTSQWGPEVTTDLGRPRCLASFVVELPDGTREHVQCEHGHAMGAGKYRPHVMHMGVVQFKTAEHGNGHNHMFQVSWMSWGS